MVALGPAKAYFHNCHSYGLLKVYFSVTSDFRQRSSTRRTFKTSNGPTSASSKVKTTLGACYANKPRQICQSEKFAVAYELAFCSANLRIHLIRLFRLFLKEESRWIKNMVRKKKRLLLEFVHDYFLLHAPNLNDRLSILSPGTLVTARHSLTRVRSSTRKVNVPKDRAS